MLALKIITMSFLASCVGIGAETLQHSRNKVDKLRFGYLAIGSLISLFYIVI